MSSAALLLRTLEQRGYVGIGCGKALENGQFPAGIFARLMRGFSGLRGDAYFEASESSKTAPTVKF